MFRGRVRHVHFVGIGGIGMSGLAEVLRTLEFDVSGSDLRPNENTRRLETLGVKLFFGHAADNVVGADVARLASEIDRLLSDPTARRVMAAAAATRGRADAARQVAADLLALARVEMRGASHLRNGNGAGPLASAGAPAHDPRWN